jgi:carboxypeptidase D
LKRLLPLAVILALGITIAPAAGRGEPGTIHVAQVAVANDEELRRLHELDMDVDGVFNGWARVYVLQEEIDKLRGLGFFVRVIPNEAQAMAQAEAEREAAGIDIGEPTYHTYTTLTSELQAIAAAYPNIVRLFSLGQSVQGRQLWMVLITDSPDTQEDEPEFAYISSMHGDEVVGKEVVFDLIEYLTQNYGTISRVTNLVNTTEIWIMPSMNPDGTQNGVRYNAHSVDLNRDFPDQFDDPVNTTAGREPETVAVMNWRLARSLVLSANMHGGALVANYPFDSDTTQSNTFNPTPLPDHDVFYSISRTYADNNPPMSVNNAEPSFDDGVTNGSDWYSIRGGMQDWEYVWNGTFEITLELSNTKWPLANTLPGFWNDNDESMLAYIERVHEGVRGIVTDADTGLPVAATVRVGADPFAVYTDPDVGDYHRILLPGPHSLQFSAVGYASQVVPVTVVAGPAVRYDVALQPLPTDLQRFASRVVDGGNGAFDPGESADLAVTLHNAGGTATGVNGHLVPAGWFSTITREDATFDDIAPGANVESDAPHYGVSVDPAIPAGYKLGFAVEWHSDDASAVSQPFFLDVGAPTCQTTSATDLPKSIFDNQTTTSLIAVAANMEITEVRVPVNISHTYIGDLRITLTSPSSTVVVLHNRTGGTTNDIVGTYGVNLTPFESLSAFAGQSSAGTWRLDVADQANGDVGTVNSWSVELCGHAAGPMPEMRLRDVAIEGGAVRLNWWPYPGALSYRVYRSSNPSSLASFTQVTDTTNPTFLDTSTGSPLTCWLVTAVGPQGEGPKGHIDE